MTDDDKALYEHILAAYQQDVHGLKFALAKANAHSALKDQRIQALEAERAPKPGPPRSS